jgi:hypothetical protein
MWNGFTLDALPGYTFFPQQKPGEDEGHQQRGTNWKKIAQDQQLATFDFTKSGFDFQVYKHGGGNDDSKGGNYLWMGKTFPDKSKPDFKC